MGPLVITDGGPSLLLGDPMRAVRCPPQPPDGADVETLRQHVGEIIDWT